MRSLVICAAAGLTAAVVGLAMPAAAEACGCLSPPMPDPAPVVDPEKLSYGVNQEAEQIIFEVEPGWVTAHVLIRYSGKPEKFGWLVPVPDVPEISLSQTEGFAMLERLTAPQITVWEEDLCPDPEYLCQQRPPQMCGGGGGGGFGCGMYASSGSSYDDYYDQPYPPDPNDPTPIDGVTVHSRQTIGAYDTVVLGGGGAPEIIDWLQAEGFVVNDTMTPFMQPYLDAGMLFVASRLLPGAGVDQIAPLKMRYPAQQPMIPLRLTAVAAEPHMTVQVYIAGSTYFEPDGHPVVPIDEHDLSADSSGRINYPMVLARAVDRAGGTGWVIEYAGGMLPGLPGEPGGELLDELAARHSHLTRLTTRLSPEEMTFDPAFRPTTGLPGTWFFLTGTRYVLDRCADDVIDGQGYAELAARQDCASVYCATGDCVATSGGRAACRCDAGSVARSFLDQDGRWSVTCVPEVGTVDLTAGGLPVPDLCQAVTCGSGVCVDVGGFPACRCDAGSAARLDPITRRPFCTPVTADSSHPGGNNVTAPFDEMRVCSPPPPQCGDDAYLVPNPWLSRRGESCPSNLADPIDLEPLGARPCKDDDGCSSGGAAGLGLMWLLIGLLPLFRRRRRR